MPLSRRQFLAGVAAGATLASHPLLWSAPTASGGRKLGIAFVGLGYYATQELAPAVEESEHLRITAVVTGDRSKGERWAKKYGFPASSIYGYDTMAQLASNKDVDLVYVVTPPGLHLEHVRAAAAAGKHVVCEKPMANTAAEAAAMIQACRAAGVQLAVGYRLHFDPYHQELMRLAESAEVGPFRSFKGGHAFRISGKPWRVNKKLAGGGPLPDVGIYVIQAACMAANAAPIAVTAQERPKTRPEVFTEVEEALDFRLEFPNGAVAEGFTSYNEQSNFVRAESPRGWIELGPAFSYRGIEGKTHQGPLSFPKLRQQQRHLDAIASAILANRPVPTPGELGLRDMQVIDAIYASAASGGKRVAIGS